MFIELIVGRRMKKRLWKMKSVYKPARCVALKLKVIKNEFWSDVIYKKECNKYHMQLHVSKQVFSVYSLKLLMHH